MSSIGMHRVGGGKGSRVQPDAPNLQMVPPPRGFPNRPHTYSQYGTQPAHTEHTRREKQEEPLCKASTETEMLGSTEKNNLVFEEALLKGKTEF